MTTFITICTDVEGIRQEFADALELEDEWQVPPDIDLEIEVGHDWYQKYDFLRNGVVEQTYNIVEKVLYEGKELYLTHVLREYLEEKLEMVTV